MSLEDRVIDLEKTLREVIKQVEWQTDYLKHQAGVDKEINAQIKFLLEEEDARYVNG